MFSKSFISGALSGLFIAIVVACVSSSSTDVHPSGDELQPKTAVLEAGANALQSNTPVDRLGVYLVGFHPMKEDPNHQMTAHHYCNQINEDFAQCALFDGNTKTANLNGIEYIISEKIYQSLPASEQKYWHPHNYEILSGQLVAPGIPEVAEHALMKQKMNSYGKTWHVWQTGGPGLAADKLPLGEPMLAWSFNRDGEAKPGLVDDRDDSLGVDTVTKKARRQDLVPLARPQGGVDALVGEFEGPTKPIAGVTDNGSSLAH